jgi:hypothetical protein
MLIELIAPRPVYIASSSEDLAADPRGAFLSARMADSIYKLLDLNGLGVDVMPPMDEPVGETVRYHLRTGGHDMTYYDWDKIICFADRIYKTNSAPWLSP